MIFSSPRRNKSEKHSVLSLNITSDTSHVHTAMIKINYWKYQPIYKYKCYQPVDSQLSQRWIPVFSRFQVSSKISAASGLRVNMCFCYQAPDICGMSPVWILKQNESENPSHFMKGKMSNSWEDYNFLLLKRGAWVLSGQLNCPFPADNKKRTLQSSVCVINADHKSFL